MDVKSFLPTGLQNTSFQIFFEEYPTKIFVLLKIFVYHLHVLELNQENDRKPIISKRKV